MYDDNRGVVEPLNEPGIDGKGLIVRGRHFVILDNIDNSTFYHRMLGELLMMKEFPLFVNDSGDPQNYMQKYATNVSFISKSMYSIVRIKYTSLLHYVKFQFSPASNFFTLCPTVYRVDARTSPKHTSADSAIFGRW